MIIMCLHEVETTAAVPSAGETTPTSGICHHVFNFSITGSLRMHVRFLLFCGVQTSNATLALDCEVISPVRFFR